jgi:hypothetical protein
MFDQIGIFCSDSLIIVVNYYLFVDLLLFLDFWARNLVISFFWELENKIVPVESHLNSEKKLYKNPNTRKENGSNTKKYSTNQ